MHSFHAKQMEHELICQNVPQQSYLISKGLRSSLWLDGNKTLSLAPSPCVFCQEEQSILAEEEGIVQVPLEGHYKYGPDFPN